jgi:hypothetical protein
MDARDTISNPGSNKLITLNLSLKGARRREERRGHDGKPFLLQLLIPE